MPSLPKEITAALDAATRPLYLFDNDPDGLAAFLLLYKKIKEGKGIPIKTAEVGEDYLQQVNNYAPDCVIILDKPKVSLSFIHGCSIPVIWIDHHEEQEAGNALYYNPKTKKQPTSHYVYQYVKENSWLATVGIVADWQLPTNKILSQFNKAYPDYKIAPITTDPLFTTKMGTMAEIFSFALKGSSGQVRKHINILTRIEHPKQLFEEETAQAKLVMRHYKKHKEQYTNLIKKITITEDPLVVFTYSDSHNSYTTDIANEILYKHPEKIVLIARSSNGSYKCSLRSITLPINKALQACLHITGGDGGGHTHACGAVIPEERFNEFVDLFREKIT